VHIAGIVEEHPPATTFVRVNVGGTRHLLEAALAAGHPGFVYISSLGADTGESEYHASKRRAETLVHEYGGGWVILRPGNVYGPGDETISLWLKMVRMLPAVPIVEQGEQPFHPIWCGDLGRAIARVIADLPRYAGQTIELTGAEVTTTNDLINRLSRLLNRHPARLPVSAWLAEFGAQTLEAFGLTGQALLQRAGLTPPLNAAKLSLLLGGNVASESGRNRLRSDFGIEPTSLQDGLQKLADAYVSSSE
jgi:NADH dehydrogenase